MELLGVGMLWILLVVVLGEFLGLGLMGGVFRGGVVLMGGILWGGRYWNVGNSSIKSYKPISYKSPFP